ncbi:MAG: imidazole glycerol phosphate synthase subunit HisH [Chthonomonas sp.]|nr:imidazole glycerol phosphate synthase subunit HisH [Chthonomonas sp.]
MIGILDYGAGNLFSLENAFRHLNLATRRVRLDESWDDLNRMVLPGVGHFGAMMQALGTAGAERLRAFDRPLLGICLGMQALFDSSEEAPGQSGLGLLRGDVKAFGCGVRTPHMGWARVQFGAQEDWFYFANSYAVTQSDAAWGMAEHGHPFVAAVRSGRVTGAQFHPEKSGAAGLEFMRRWATDAG